MSPLWPALRTVVSDLSAAQAKFALVGGLAAGARTEPRFTRDVDLAVAVADDAEAEALVHRLLAMGYRANFVIEQEAVGRLATVRLVPRESRTVGAIVDLLFASCGIESEIIDAAEPITFSPGLVVPVARVHHLIAMKLLSESPQRPQDRVDLVRLVQEADERDLVLVRDSLALIEARGFSRGRTLIPRLETLLDEVGL